MDKATTTADALELLHLNQIAIRAALEELSLWVSQRGSTNVHDNVMNALQTLDRNAGAINSAIELLRSDHGTRNAPTSGY
ncbi:hypothetical protein [Pseudomonas sp. BEA3.1]|uniref:hypothetical protein n=1 Tax=Pseudomonas sp. BEA3.1 TaxID=3083251 RepID=UPI0029641059|nr:hypothetical protein [Pseudomonas sp. BEA3.1]MDW2779761.1 hypothetical protein [Pseudomonas sp. BEA3.1]